jgi:CelD/BcsL family acetyltransferase involved in cellulose biosynthesis
MGRLSPDFVVSTGGLGGEVHHLGLEAAADEAAAIADLAGRALEYNVFREPEFMLPALGCFAPKAEILTVRRTGRLDAVLPLARQSGLFAGGRVPTVFANEFQPLGTPLIDRRAPEDLWTMALDAVAETASALVLPHLRLDGPVYATLEAAARRHGRSLFLTRGESRAVLTGGRSFSDWWNAHPRHRRKEDARLWRRLLERGVVTSGVATGEGALLAFHEFLALEGSGWKGRGATALRDDPRVRAFAETAIKGLARRGLIAIDRIDLDGRPIAMLIRLGGPVQFVAWKIAYDEAESVFSPGVRVFEQATQRMLADLRFAEADSLAVATHPLAGSRWQERAPMGTVIVGLDRSGHRARLAAAELGAAAALKQAAKGVIGEMRRLGDRR